MQIETIRGVVGRVFFSNPDSPAMAGVLNVNGGSPVRFAGKVAAATGDKLEIVGTWTVHPKFGRQFTAESGMVKMDESADALVHLLATHDSFKGLGPSRARQVVDAAMSLSEDGGIGEALIAYPQEISELSKVSLSIVREASKAWESKREYFAALASLGEQGWSGGQAIKIVAKLGNNAPALVRSDPYYLIGKISRFGFRTVDAVARKIGIASTDPHRLSSGIAFCLDRNANDGDTWIARDDLFNQALEELQPDTLDGEAKTMEALDGMILTGLVASDVSPEGSEIVADAMLAKIERSVFDRLIQGLQDSSVQPFDLSSPNLVSKIETLNSGQRLALLGCSSHRFGVISGGAGVGKTYLMDSICTVAEQNGMKVALCAPTGKAARKLEQSTQREAKTIHRTLEPVFNSEAVDGARFTFTRGASNPIEANLIIVDEFSMVDVRLMHSLLQAVGKGSRLIMVGDHHQIPSVGPGAILRDLLAGRQNYGEAVTVLTEIVRQAGVLARNTTAILDGVVSMRDSESWGVVRTEKGHEERAASMAASVVEALVTAPEPLEPFGRKLDLSWDIQVLAPMRKGPLGTWALNVELQKLRQRLEFGLVPEPTPENKAPKPMVGDRIIWTVNDYELGLFNGTQAIVTKIHKGGAIDLFTEDGAEVTIPNEKRFNVEVAYAMTIHKSQGSEWPCVILVASSGHWIMRDRNLLYTGASRAAESLTILGDVAGIKSFAQSRRSANRKTFGDFLVQGWTPSASAV